MARITISIPDEVADEVDAQLEYGDSRSEWIQTAIEQRLEREADAENRSPAESVLAD